MSTAKRLRRARRSTGLSAGGLSRKAGLSDGYVALLEAGTRSIGLRALTALAPLLGVSVEWLLSGRGEGPTAKKAA